jgi:protein-disulfide isomerase
MRNPWSVGKMVDRSFTVICVVALLGCASPEQAVYAEKSKDAKKTTSKTDPPGSNTVIAVVGDQEITEAEVEASVAAELLKVERDRRDILERGLEQLVDERLIELEAAKRNMSVESLLEAEIAGKISEPTDQEIDAFYEQRKGQIRQPKEEVVDRIRDYLRQQRGLEAHTVYVADLRDSYGYKSYLEPFRMPVADSGFPSKGPESAPVTIVEFSDFECPFCSRVNPALDQVVERYGDKVRVVFRQFPLSRIHPNAQKAAEASLCADEQERFWEMHDLMFRDQRNLGVAALKEKATTAGLDMDSFNECLDSDRFADAVAADLKEGGQLGVTGTPALFINGRFLSGAQPFEEFSKIIDDELAGSGVAESGPTSG